MAQERRLALIDPDDELDHAVALALSPWGMSVLVKHDAAPGTSLPTASERARALAVEWHVSAVVWLSPSEHGSLLWIYELETDSVSTRQLAEAPPFSSPSAASVALTLKSLLRTGPVVRPSSTPPPTPTPPSAPAVPAPGQKFTANAELSLRYLARAAHETRGAVGGVWWLGARPSQWGIGLKASAGPGIDIGRGAFTGQLRQLSLSAGVSWRVIGSRFIASSLIAGVSGHYTELNGFDRELERATALRRLAASIDAGSEVTLSLLGPVRAGFGVRAMYFPVRERYLAHGTPVFESWPVAAEFGASLGVDLL
ncbi:MAG: hypothetical protein K0R38_3953 [Polyangiaceae bacterium]|jgi:hypothetical protein|nr:hypothetical protein [Polyangiaceae bacterium]